MKRILGEVSVKELDGCLKKIMELLEHKQLGHYYLHELGQLLSEAPAKVLYQKWLNELSSHFIWKRAEDHFKKTKQLWYNELSWPFQICVLKIGGLTNEQLYNKCQAAFKFLDPEKETMRNIRDLNLFSEFEEDKIFLIRLQTKFLGLPNKTEISEVACNHPELNLSVCPTETAFFMRPLVKEYFDSNDTIFAMDFEPSTMIDKSKKRFFYFSKPRRGYRDDLFMSSWDISKKSEVDQNTYWIFQYDQTIKNSID